jgi:hypothetical protein
MRDLADLARNLVEGLFDSYRPELHYMRGPGPKWRAKHERTLRLGHDLAAPMPRPDHAYVRPLISNCHSAIATLASVASLVLGIALLVIALLVSAPTASKADDCPQASDLAAARLRWAAARQSRVDSAQNENRCRVYRIHFYDAVTARQLASVCENGVNRQRDLDLLDFEIDAFNNLIAAQCGA